MTKLSLLIISAALTVVSAAAADTQKPLLKVSDIKIARVADELSVAIDINPAAVNPGRDKEVVFTPVVRAMDSSDSIVLPSVKIAGRNRYYSHLRNNNLLPGERLWEAGGKDNINYRVEVPFEPWMMHCRVDMGQSLANCCQSANVGPDSPLAILNFEKPVYTPEFRFVDLTGDSAIRKTAEGRAFVDFIVNRTEIREHYRRNRVELAKIIKSIDVVKNDPDATITRITIKGFASPEGPYDNNVRLAMGRTAALKEYVREHYNFDPELMSTDYEPEDWEGLKAWVEQCTLPHRDEILQIIDSSLAPDPKNSEIQRRYPQEYKLMLDSIYPALRHSDYTVKYKIRTFVTIEELKRVYAATPDRLRPVDFQRIAATYKVGSPEYREVMATAVREHPDDPQCNINAATAAMIDGDYKAADAYLAKAGDSAEAIYSRGVLAGLTGDLDRAKTRFADAAALGLDIAADEAKRIKDLTDRPTVKYLIVPSK